MLEVHSLCEVLTDHELLEQAFELLKAQAPHRPGWLLLSRAIQPGGRSMLYQLGRQSPQLLIIKLFKQK